MAGSLIVIGFGGSGLGGGLAHGLAGPQGIGIGGKGIGGGCIGMGMGMGMGMGIGGAQGLTGDGMQGLGAVLFDLLLPDFGGDGGGHGGLNGTPQRGGNGIGGGGIGTGGGAGSVIMLHDG